MSLTEVLVGALRAPTCKHWDHWPCGWPQCLHVEDKMPRSKYIYFVREADYPGSQHRLLGVFTVKREANLWAFKHSCDPDRVTLSRMRDGVGEDEYPETVIDWAEDIRGLVQ